MSKLPLGEGHFLNTQPKPWETTWDTQTTNAPMVQDETFSVHHFVLFTYLSAYIRVAPEKSEAYCSPQWTAPI